MLIESLKVILGLLELRFSWSVFVLFSATIILLCRISLSLASLSVYSECLSTFHYFFLFSLNNSFWLDILFSWIFIVKSMGWVTDIFSSWFLVSIFKFALTEFLSAGFNVSFAYLKTRLHSGSWVHQIWKASCFRRAFSIGTKLK